MKFTILSHACLYVEQDNFALLVDPWLRGSAYWRSWWNYPPVDPEAIRALRPTHIFLTHIHWDHFHGTSLRLFSKDTPIFVPQDRYDRMTRDLRAMGFKNVVSVAHARTVRLGESLAFRPYNFLPTTDTALVIYSPTVTLLDANDCKISGWPLSQLTGDFPRIDFAFRSHSSANARICREYIDQSHEGFDDRESYLRSFSNFMRVVRPRYAVPFASNHCHLHRETIQFNDYIQTPLDVGAFFTEFRDRVGLNTELKVMLPGSSWSEVHGFELVSTSAFTERKAELKRYASENQKKLEEYYYLEAKATVTTEQMRKFFDPFFAAVPRLVRRTFLDHPLIMIAEGGASQAQWRIDVYRGTVEPIDHSESLEAPARLHCPAIVLRQSLRMNMFGHAAISKRVRYRATAAEMPFLKRFEMLLWAYEYEFLPIRRNFSLAALKISLRRWREVMFYVHVGLHLLAGKTPMEIEQRALRKAAARRA